MKTKIRIIGRRDCETDSLAEENRDEGNKFGENGASNCFELCFPFWYFVCIGWPEEQRKPGVDNNMWRLDSQGKDPLSPNPHTTFPPKVGTWQDRYEHSGPTSRQPNKPSNRDSNLRETSRDLLEKHEINYPNHRDRPRARDCSSNKRDREPNKKTSDYRCNRSRDPSRGSSRDSLDQTSEGNRRRNCVGSKPPLQRQGTFTGKQEEPTHDF